MASNLASARLGESRTRIYRELLEEVDAAARDLGVLSEILSRADKMPEASRAAIQVALDGFVKDTRTIKVDIASALAHSEGWLIDFDNLRTRVGELRIRTQTVLGVAQENCQTVH